MADGSRLLDQRRPHGGDSTSAAEQHTRRWRVAGQRLHRHRNCYEDARQRDSDTVEPLALPRPVRRDDSRRTPSAGPQGGTSAMGEDKEDAVSAGRRRVRAIIKRLQVCGRRWGALGVALLALATSVWSAYEDRRHKHLSVKPQLTLSFSFHEGVSAGWMMSNAGLGPAIVQRFEAYVDDRPQIQWDSFADSLGIQRPHALGFANVYSLQIISPGLPEPLLTVRLDQSKPA